MTDQSAELVRAGRCACAVDESRLSGREIAGFCNGERYIPYSTMYAHYKSLKKRMAKKGKHDITRPKIEMVPRHVVCFTHDPCNWRQGIPQAQTLEASNEDIYCDDNGDYGGDDAWHGGGGDADWVPVRSQTRNEVSCSGSSTDGEAPENKKRETSEEAENTTLIGEEEEEEDEDEEEREMDLEEQLQAGADAFAKKRTEEEVYGDTLQQRDVIDLQMHVEQWRLKCSYQLSEGTQATLGDDVRDLLNICLKRATPIGNVWEMFDYRSKYNPSYFTGKDLRSIVRKMGMKFMLEVTCESHHPPQPDSRRGEQCGYQDTGDSEPCKLILKIGIRRDSIKNYLSRKLLDPEFCHLLDETNDKYWKDIETGEEDGNMSSIFHGRLYQSIAKKYPNFFYSDDHIPLHLGIFADGFQPFEGVAHTLFAVILVCFNLPQEVRMREENLHILTLIDGPKEPNAKFQQYVKPIVDELLEFWDEGWHLHHAVAGKSILCKGACTCCLQDGRASKACSMQSEAGHYHGCRICSLHGQQANGVHYFQHTALLPLDHPYRIEEGGFGRFEDHVMIKDDQFIRSRMEILDQHPEFCNETVFMGVQGKSEFSRLPYFDLSVGHVLCFMHCLANTGMNLLHISTIIVPMV